MPGSCFNPIIQICTETSVQRPSLIPHSCRAAAPLIFVDNCSTNAAWFLSLSVLKPNEDVFRLVVSKAAQLNLLCIVNSHTWMRYSWRRTKEANVHMWCLHQKRSNHPKLSSLIYTFCQVCQDQYEVVIDSPSAPCEQDSPRTQRLCLTRFQNAEKLFLNKALTYYCYLFFHLRIILMIIHLIFLHKFSSFNMNNDVSDSIKKHVSFFRCITSCEEIIEPRSDCNVDVFCWEFFQGDKIPV